MFGHDAASRHDLERAIERIEKLEQKLISYQTCRTCGTVFDKAVTMYQVIFMGGVPYCSATCSDLMAKRQAAHELAESKPDCVLDNCGPKAPKGKGKK